VNTSAHAYSAPFKTSLPYDPLRDFTPIAPISSQPYVLVAGARTGVRTFAELVAAAQGRPAGMKFGSSGIGTATHVGVVKLNLETRIEALHVPARGADAIGDTIGHVVAGTTDYAMSPISIALPHIRAQSLFALGVSTARRSRLLPDVPTLAEAGATGFDFPIWYGLWAPARTPAEVVSNLSKSVALVLAEPALRDRLAGHDADPMTMAQMDFHRFVLSESEVAKQILETTGSLATKTDRVG
jgi:tripartite-type tricarboxylate transporter receptor subunit TctC